MPAIVGDVEEEDTRSLTPSSPGVLSVYSSKSTSGSNHSRDVVEEERASATPLEELESYVVKRDAELDLEVKTASRDIKELWRSIATLRWQARSHDIQINALAYANQAIQGDIQALQNPVVSMDDAPGEKSSRKSQLIREDILSKPWIAHVSLLPRASQSLPFGKNSSAYKRALSRGLHRTIAIPGPDSQSFIKTISSEFASLLKGRRWMPLRVEFRGSNKFDCLPILRQLPLTQLDENLYDLEFLKNNCATLDTNGNILDLYIAMRDYSFSWAELRRLPPVTEGLESSWEYNRVIDGPREAEQGNTTSVLRSGLTLMPPRVTRPLVHQNRDSSNLQDSCLRAPDAHRMILTLGLLLSDANSYIVIASKDGPRKISQGPVDIINAEKKREDRNEPRSSDRKRSDYHKSSRKPKR
jgi:hypothetical protein